MLFDQNGRIAPTQGGDQELTLEAQSMIFEAAMLDTLSPSELQAFTESHADVNAVIHGEILTEKTIVRLDKAAKLSRAQKVAIFTIAKEKNDPQFKKLLTVWRMERFLESQLLRKYGNEGMRRARTAMNKPAKSTSALVKKVATNVTKQFNGPVKR